MRFGDSFTDEIEPLPLLASAVSFANLASQGVPTGTTTLFLIPPI